MNLQFLELTFAERTTAPKESFHLPSLVASSATTATASANGPSESGLDKNAEGQALRRLHH